CISAAILIADTGARHSDIEPRRRWYRSPFARRPDEAQGGRIQ
ncbi:MAG: hypothetical protein ACJASK_001231, partial [Ilumatobacter sp.]